MSDRHQPASPLVAHGLAKYMSFSCHAFITDSVWTFAELGVADLLAAANKPQTAEELAHSQGWDSGLLYRILRTVADADIVREIKSGQGKDQDSLQPEKINCFELTDDGRLLMSDHPSKARYMVCLELGSLSKRTSLYLPQLVREGLAKGNGFQLETGNPSAFDFMKDPANREVAHCFNEAMTSVSTITSEAIANTVDFSSFSTLVDIGGNLGVLLATILAKYPSIKQGICFDLPNVVEQAATGREFEQRKVTRDRYRHVGGDMFDAKTIPQADAYIIQSIIHDWSDDNCISFLKAIRVAAKGRSVTLFIAELVILPIEEDKWINWRANAMDIHLMKTLSAKERTEKQYEYLLEKSGFTFQRLHLTSTPFSVIEATANG